MSIANEKSRALAVLVHSERMIQAIEAGVATRGGGRIVRCASMSRLVSLARGDSLSGIVYEAAFDGRGPHAEIAVLCAEARCPVLVAMMGLPHAVKDLFEFTRHPRDQISYVVAFSDELQRSVSRLLGPVSEPSAVARILDVILPLVPSPLWNFVTTAAVLTQTDADVERLERACGVSGSALRTTARNAGVAPPHVWVGCLRAAHATWGCIELGRCPSVVTKRLCFPNRSALAHCVHKYTGRSLTRWSEGGEFVAVLGECIERCLRRVGR